ncbi:MAG: phasin family protein [Halanaerobiales bacterium]
MRNIFKDLLATGLGAMVLTKEKAEEMVDSLIEQGKISQKEGREILDEFMEKSEEKSSELYGQVTDQIRKKLRKAGFVTRDDYDQLQDQINELKEEVHELKMKE